MLPVVAPTGSEQCRRENHLQLQLEGFTLQGNHPAAIRLAGCHEDVPSATAAQPNQKVSQCMGSSARTGIAVYG